MRSVSKKRFPLCHQSGIDGTWVKEIDKTQEVVFIVVDSGIEQKKGLP
jgi:hypothetical protein